MWKFLKEAWAICKEAHETHRALRILSKQEWSVEFLTALLVRASKITHVPLEMVLSGPHGHQLVIRSVDEHQSVYKHDDIFDHLDDENRVRQFMAQVNRR